MHSNEDPWQPKIKNNNNNLKISEPAGEHKLELLSVDSFGNLYPKLHVHPFLSSMSTVDLF